MAGIRLEFAQFGDFDSFNIYRSAAPMDIAALPSPLVTGLTTMYYVDTAVVDGATYYYRAQVWRDGVSSVSTEVKVIASLSDEYFNSVELLLFADAAEKGISNQFTDLSPNGRIVTAATPTRVLTPKFNQGHIYFNNNRISVPITTMGTGDFTAEMWVALDAANSMQWSRLMQFGQNGTDGAIYVIRENYTNPMSMRIDAHIGNYFTVCGDLSKTVSNNKYHHICAMRKSGIFYLFVDGVLQSSNNTFLTYNVTATTLYLFANDIGYEYVSGVFDSFRLSSAAVYSEFGFTAPPSDFAVTGDTALLIKSNGVTVSDYSIYGRTITKYNDPVILIPKYDQGEIYFNGNNDRLAVDIAALGLADFTIECHVHLGRNSTADYGRIMQLANTNVAEGGLYIVFAPNSTYVLVQGVTGASYFDIGQYGDIPLSSWVHLCMMRKDGAFYLYLDGVVKASDLLHSSYNVTQTKLNIGSNSTGGELARFSLSGARITKVARYDVGGFTPPVAKYPAQ